MKDVDGLKSKYFSQIDDRETEGWRQEAMVDILPSITVMPDLVVPCDQSVTWLPEPVDMARSLLWFVKVKAEIGKISWLGEIEPTIEVTLMTRSGLKVSSCSLLRYK